MGSTTTSAVVEQAEASFGSILAQGDAIWAGKASQLREADVAMDWPNDLMLPFSLRMAVHGNRISRPLMGCDRRYAMQQLVFAHSLPDTRLQKLSAQMLVHFEERQTGRQALH